MPVTDQTLRLSARLRREIGTIVDDRTRALTAAWVAAWDEHAAEWEAAVLAILAVDPGNWPAPWRVARLEQAQRVLARSADAIGEIVGKAAPQIADDATRAIHATLDAQPRIARSQLPSDAKAAKVGVTIHPDPRPETTRGPQLARGIAGEGAATLDVSFDRVPTRAIEWMVERTIQQITSTLLPLEVEATAAMNAELIRGVEVGASPRETAARMVDRVEGRFNGGLTRALAVATTETMDAHRWAALAGRLANSEVLAGYRWTCHYGPRTCPACIAMDGTVFPIDDGGPNDHVRGRCTATPLTRSWADLGIEGLDEPEAVTRTARDWFAEQDEATQRAILGPGRLKAMQDGRIGWDDVARARTNAGWRNSVEVTPLRDLIVVADDF